MTGSKTFISCTPEQPLFTITQDFLPKDDFHAMQGGMRDHPYKGGNALNGENFQKTEGFVIKFNSEGIDRLKQDPALDMVSEYFERARHPYANAWVLNMLVCKPHKAASDTVEGRGTGVGDMEPLPLSVAPHVDETLGTRSKDAFMAHVVNVLYVSVPASMSSGHLEMYGYSWWRAKLFPYLLSFLSIEQLDRVLPPDASVQPVENTMVSFRGDTIHRVQGFTVDARRDHQGESEDVALGPTAAAEHRVSLVLEQYRVPLHAYGLTTAYELSAGSLHDEGRRGANARAA